MTVTELDQLADRHDLVVVASRGGFGEVFPVVPDRSPHTEPLRILSAGLYTGVAYTEPLGVTFAVSPGHAEIIEIPIQTFEGNATTLLFECVPGGDLEALARTPYSDDPKAHERLALEKLRRTSRPSSREPTRRPSG